MRLDISTSAVRTDVDGEWQDIDTSIVAGEDGLEVVSPVVEMVFSDGSEGQPLVRMVRDGHGISMDVPFDLTEPQILGDTVMYPEVLPGVDLLVTVNKDGTGISEVLRVESPEAAANPVLAELALPLESPTGLDVQADAGGFVAADGAGAEVFVSPAPAMWDSSARDDAGAAEEDAPQTLLAWVTDVVSEAAGSLTDSVARLEAPLPGDEVVPLPVELGDGAVVLTPDAELLSGADTDWPVYIDPSLGITQPTERLAVRSGYSNYYNFPDSQGVGLCNRADPYGSSCPATFTSRLLYEFGGLDAIGAMTSTDVIRATFTVFGEHSYSCTPTNVQLYRVSPFSSGTGWPGGTWMSLLQTQTISHRASCGTQRWVEFDVTSAADAIANENVNTLALGLKAADESRMAGWKRYQWDARLSIVYNRPPNKPTNLRVVTGTAVQQCTDGGTAYIGPNGANLVATLSDPDQGAMLRGNFNLYTQAAYVQSSPPILFDPPMTGSQASGLTHTVTVPDQINDATGQVQAGMLAHGGRYVWTVDATDDNADLTRWSPKTVCNLIADFQPPAAKPTVTPLPVPAGVTGVAEYVSGGEANGGVGVPGNFVFAYPQADDIAGYRYSWNDDSAFAWIAGASPTITITPRGFGPQFLRVQAVDKGGNVGPALVYDFVVARSGPASEWRFDSGALYATAPDGTVVPDVSDALGDHSLTTWGSPRWARGAATGQYPNGVDRAMKFTGSARAVSRGPVVRTDESFTVMAMVRLNTIPGGSATAVSQDGGTVAGFSLGYRHGTYCGGSVPGCWSFFMYGSNGVSAPITAAQSADVPVKAGQWVQLAGMYDAVTDEARLMVCTIPSSSDPQVLVSDDSVPFTTPWNAAGKLRVGQAMQGTSMVRGFPGEISGVRVYAGVADDADFSRACAKGYWDMPLDPTGEDVDTALPAESDPVASTEAPPAEMPEFNSMGGTWPAGGVRTIAVGEHPGGTSSVPISLVTSDNESIGEQATVELLSHANAVRAGVTGLLFEVTPAASSTDLTDAIESSAVQIAVDTSDFAGTYGGGYAQRLRIVQLPECATTDQAGQPECQVQTQIATVNDAETGLLMATVPAGSASGGTFAVTAGTSGASGDWGATSLSPSASWEVTAQSGNFSWSYPMRVPPGLGGPVPELSLDYSSGSVDGQVSSTNNQSSWIGDGWDLTTGYIERQYVSCSEDMDAPANNAGHETSDLCWKTDNATMVLAGQAQELVKIQVGGIGGAESTWRLKADDGTRVLRFTGGTNGDNDGEYWVVTTPDGTRYTFGREYRGGDVPSGTSPDPHNLGSAWTVPVYSNHLGEGGIRYPEGVACHQASFAASRCQQAWRWNLDYVVDTSGNSMTYWYTEEGNAYTSNYTPSSNGGVVQYVRGGYLTRIDYGQRAGTETGTTTQSTAPAWVKFDTTERCHGTCGDGEVITEANATKWPDVPADLICTSATRCPTVGTPAFFTRRKLSVITTYVRDGGERKVDQWTLTQTFPDPGDGTDPHLWLDSVQHTGSPGASTQVPLPPVRFSGVQLPNRVDMPLDAGAPMNHFRLNSIITETGGATSIKYSPAECTHANTIGAGLAPENNRMRCFPVHWTPDGAEDPIMEYFHKYLVTSVVENSRDVASKPVETHYVYGAGANTADGEDALPAWRYDDNPLVPQDERTFNEFAGYSTVRVITGGSDNAADPNARSMVEYHYYRGLHGSHPTPASRPVQVHGINDAEPLAGFAWKTVTYNGATVAGTTYTPGLEVATDYSTPWTASMATGLDGTTTTAVRTSATETHTAASQLPGGERVTRTTTTYDPTTALPVWVDDEGDISTDADDLCTHTAYSSNTSANILGATTMVRTSAGRCPALTTNETERYEDYQGRLNVAFTALPPISGTLTLYDGQAWGAAPTRGLVTETQIMAEDGPDLGKALDFVRQSTTTYDTHGRPTTVTDALERTTTTAYDSAVEGGPLTSTKVTTPPATSDDESAQETTTTVDPAWGSPVATTDTNGKVTTATYDGLGRITAVWKPGRVQGQDSADTLYAYTLNPTTGVSAVTTKTLATDGVSYRVSTQLYDALLRARQTQTESAARDTAGRVITDTTYDSRGQVTLTNGEWFTTGTPSATVINPGITTVVPSTSKTVYDGLGRTIAEIFEVNGVEQWRTTTTYDGDRTTIDPPTGETATTTVIDSRGQTTQLWQYLGSDPTGTPQVTTYAYDRAGRLASMTDPAGNAWTYTYDLRGRQIKATDPDKGTTTTTYDNAGQVLTTTDARGEVLAYVYDGLGRKTALWSGAVDTGTRLATWQYDTLAEGQLSSSTRYTDGKEYTAAVTGYDDGYRPLGQLVTIPDQETGVAGTYETTFTYAPNGAQATVTLPAIGNLHAETLTTVYDQVDMPRWLVGTSGTYVADSLYSAYGEPLQYDLGTTYSATVTYSYAEGTRRLDRAWLWTEGHQGYPMDVTYTYDAAGNPLSTVDDPYGDGNTYTQCYAYDGMRRLTSAWTPADNNCATGPSTPGGPAPYAFIDTFDAIGNRTSRTATNATGARTTTTYTYDTAAGGPSAHQLLGMTATGAEPGTGTFAYDAAGNTTTRDAIDRAPQTLSWDPEGRLAAVSVDGNAYASFVYTADGDRLIRREAGVTTLYLPGGQELTYTGQATTATRYYGFNGQTIAVRTGAGYSDVTTLISDPQGTAQIAVDNGDNQITRRYFDPYGQPLTGGDDWAGDHGFLNKPTDDTGLTQIGARYYDPTIGRFISVDPIMDLADPQQWQGYAYANNNPVTYSDPTGLKAKKRHWSHRGLKKARPAVPARVTAAEVECRPERPTWTEVLSTAGDGGLAFLAEATGTGMTGGLPLGEGAVPSVVYGADGIPTSMVRDNPIDIWNRNSLTSPGWLNAGKALPFLDLAMIGAEGVWNYNVFYADIEDGGERLAHTVGRTVTESGAGIVAGTAVFAGVMLIACPFTAGTTCGLAVVATATVASGTAGYVAENSAGEWYDSNLGPLPPKHFGSLGVPGKV